MKKILKSKKTKVFIICLILFLIIRFLFAGLSADKYCKDSKNLNRFFDPGTKYGEYVEPTQEERQWLGEDDPEYKISTYSRAVRRCLNEQGWRIWPGLI